MNQYEIELRDKYFEKSLDAQLSCPGVVPQMNDVIKWANDFADDCMAERQKHLDKAEMINAQTAGMGEIDWDVINAEKAAGEGHKVQGTECNR